MAPVVLDEAVKEFLVESHENLDKLDREFLEMEKTSPTPERVASIFRTIHTIKGTAGFLGYSSLENLAHAGESLLSKLRAGDLSWSAPIISALLELVDKIRVHLRHIESVGTESSELFSDLAAHLNALAVGDAGVAQPSAPPPPPAEVLATPVLAVEQQIPPAVQAETPADSDEVAAWAEASSSTAVSDSSVRVDVALLDRLMNLVGELVLARNQILQFGSSVEPALASATQRLNLVTTELQEGVMKTRMQPISQVWNKLPRVVRDVAVACGKQVRVEMVGKETELDRTIIEAIRDPLTHIVRNAIDHGIESPQVRGSRKKARTGLLTLKAFHEGGQVNIEISDDGGGIDPARIRQKAQEKGLLSAEQAKRLSDREALQLIFVPGFSTAEKVSHISGRGVGMDVVKTNIEQIGGAVDIQSRLGRGTTFKLKIPLTLAIVPALGVTHAGNRFAIPQVSLLELVRLDGKGQKSIEYIHQAPVFRLRGKLLPLVRLSEVLGEPAVSREANSEEASEYIVVLQADERQFGLVVDEVHDTEEIVVKPLGTELKSISAFAGATILGDGTVALILDIAGIAETSQAVVSKKDWVLGSSTEEKTQEEVRAEVRQSLLVFRVGQDGRMALPLSWVARLEEIPFENVEKAFGHWVVQYRGEILPLLDLRQVLGLETERVYSAHDSLSVVVSSHHGHSMGWVVDEVIDIVEDNVLLTKNSTRPGTLGAAIIQGKVTELLDTETLIRRQFPEWAAEERHA